MNHINFIVTMIPTVIYTGGLFFINWGIMAGAILQQVTSGLALLNVARPLLKEPNETYQQ